MMKKIKAFTLIEIMIVMAILGILAAIAFPSYERYITKSKRAEAMAALTNAAQAMEKFKTNNYRYLVAEPLSDVFAVQVPVTGGSSYYTLSLSNQSATTYTLTATPVGSMGTKDGWLEVTHTGAQRWLDVKGVWGTKLKIYDCWPTSSSNASC